MITATCGDYSDSITVTVAYAPELTLGVPMEAVCDYGYVKLFNFTAPEDGVYIISVDSDAEMLLYTDEHSPCDANGNIIKMMNAGETACIQVYGENPDANQKKFTIRVDKPTVADAVGMSFHLNGRNGILCASPAYAED